ncbi:MAG TPA: PHP domain-containing protein [Acidimicrobiales bacterium]|nr:PHP domain-containing protein [Acidimicrobiales bacterium]
MIDLHTHSTFSDGSESPERVVELAAAAGLSTLALTDHDELRGLARAATRADELGVRLVPGCEVSCSFSPGSMHVLCYFVEPGPGPLQEELARLRADREARNRTMAERLARLGLPISYDEVLQEAGGKGVGRPHFAGVLVRKGAASSIQDAFDRYLAKGAPGYVSKARIDVHDVIERAAGSGSLAVVAHPLSLGLEDDELDRTLAGLAEAGLAGLECHYGRYDTPTRTRLVELARRHGLVATGGSDFHGSYKPDLSVGIGTGDLAVPDEVVDELEARRPRP